MPGNLLESDERLPVQRVCGPGQSYHLRPGDDSQLGFAVPNLAPPVPDS